MRGSAVGQLLAEHGVRLLLLNACRSGFAEAAAQNGGGPEDVVLGSVASDVFSAGVAGVLAMGFDVYVATAARLIASTYAALGAGRSLGEAVTHARRAEVAWARNAVTSGFDWLVPVVYEAGAAAVTQRADSIPELGEATDTTTPGLDAVQDATAGAGPRAGGRRFFGYDDVILQLDRGVRDHPVVELVGLAGIGKSAVAGEFARWAVETGAVGSVLVLDVADFPSGAALRAEVTERLRTLAGLPVLVVLDGAGRATDLDDLRELIDQVAADNGRVLLTGRAASGLDGVRTVLLDGLDPEASQELAAESGWDQAVPGRAALLEWAQGVPALLKQLPAVLAAENPASIEDTCDLLRRLRDGRADDGMTRNSDNETVQRLLNAAGLDVFDVARLTDPTLPLALRLFQERLELSDWERYCQLIALQGWQLGQGDAAQTLTRELAPAVADGLACWHPGTGFRLHPLAPMAVRDSFETILVSSTQGDSKRYLIALKRLRGAYIQTVRVSPQFLGLPRLRPGDLDRSGRPQRQNLVHAVDLCLEGAWWALAFPLARRLRDELLAGQRDDEWSALVALITATYREFPPGESEMGPENVPFQMTRLQAEEAERTGDLDFARRLREQATQEAFGQNMTMTPVGPGAPAEAKPLDLNLGPRFSALVKQGDALARSGSGDCLRLYSAACQIAADGGDSIRLAEAQLAIAHAYLNVAELYDPEAYERWARQALATAEPFASIDPDLFARCKLSVGSAILEATGRQVALTPERLAEARGSLLLAASSESTTPRTRAMARNSLGHLMRATEDLEGAAAAYLQASAEFEALTDWDAAAAAQANAAIVLSISGKNADAVSVALRAQATLEKAPDKRDQLAPILSAVLSRQPDYSYSEAVELKCPRCRRPFTADLWLIIDVQARRDLYRRVIEGSIHELRCPACLAGVIAVTSPLCLFRRDGATKLIASVPDDLVAGPAEGPGPDDQLLTFLAGRMGESWDPEWTKTALVTVLASYLERILFDEWADLGRYSQDDPLIPALTQFLNADLDGKRGLLMDFPDLVGQSAQMLVMNLAESNREKGQEARAADLEAQHALLARVAESGVDAALAAYARKPAPGE